MPNGYFFLCGILKIGGGGAACLPSTTLDAHGLSDPPPPKKKVMVEWRSGLRGLLSFLVGCLPRHWGTPTATLGETRLAQNHYLERIPCKTNIIFGFGSPKCIFPHPLKHPLHLGNGGLRFDIVCERICRQANQSLECDHNC